MNIEKKTIFRMFIIPLTVVIIVQTLISYGAVMCSGTTTLLDENAVSILNRTVENRKIILENNMLQQWANMQGETQKVNQALNELLMKRNADMAFFLRSDNMKQELLHEMLPSCLYTMRKNMVSGAFLILEEPENTEGGEYQGIYFRDADPLSNPGDYSDLLMERGSSDFSQEFSIPLDSYWTTYFQFEESGSRGADDFFYKPLEAAKTYPDAATENLAFWCPPFRLGEGDTKDSYSMITYSLPLVYEDGTVYGVIGIELSLKYLTQYLPAKELNAQDLGGYVLAEYTPEGSLIPLVTTGSLSFMAFADGSEVPVKETKYQSFWRLDGAGSKRKLYASIEELHLYNNNTPFSDHVWVLAGIQNEDEMFGIGKKIVGNLLVALLAGAAFALVCISITISHLTQPIRRLAECIGKNRLREYECSHIKEVDDLYDEVCRLTEQQKESEYALMEEKERYRIALQSSTDVLFSYDLNQDSIDIYTVASKEDGGDTVERNIGSGELKKLRDGCIHEDDRKIVEDVLKKATDEVSLIFEARMHESADQYQWMELSGKVIYDAQNERTKIIGSVKNIQGDRLQELMELNSARRDVVTGLYHRETGEKMIAAELAQGREGCLTLLDLDKFRELNERYGMVFGDAVLEQIGSIILSYKEGLNAQERVLIAIRAGGDEIILWIGGIGPQETEELVGRMKRQAGELYPDAAYHIMMSAGISYRDGKEKDYEQLLKEAKKALGYAKLMANGMTAYYGKLTEEQLQRISAPAHIDEIANRDYRKRMNMVSLVFNFFDKSSDLDGVMPVLLTKLGRFYGASDIVVSESDPEFHTVHMAYQWHADASRRIGQSAYFLTQEEFEEQTAEAAEGLPVYRKGHIPEKKREFFVIQPDRSCFVVPLYDNGTYMGAIAYTQETEQITWKEKERGELVEISKIIETNINREKYDLASRAKSDFLSRMSHEIRTPMNAIIGMTAIAIEEKNKPDRVEDCLHKIDQSSQYLLSLINDVLDMSKIESGKMKLEICNFSLRDLQTGIDTLIGPQAAAKKLRYLCETDLEEEWVKGDLLHLNQVLINLLGNAVKFTQEGGEIRFSIRTLAAGKNGVHLYFSVKDNGIGISEEGKTRIFNSFEQADLSTSRQYGGTGLGLAISDRLVHMMGGTLEVDSEVGKGSDFHFSVELERGEAHNNEKASEEVKEEVFAGKRILLAEDNNLNQEIAQTILEMHGFIVECTMNGKEALDAFAASEPGYYDCVLMDIRMPEMDGLEATKEIRSLERRDAKTIPIVAMSANAFEEDVRKSLESGMDGHLAKPIHVEEMLKKLYEMLTRVSP